MSSSNSGLGQFRLRYLSLPPPPCQLKFQQQRLCRVVVPALEELPLSSYEQVHADASYLWVAGLPTIAGQLFEVA